MRGVYKPKDDDIVGRNGLGDRANISYTNKFDTAAGDFGVSLGYQHQDQAAPEDYYITNSAFIPCVTSANEPDHDHRVDGGADRRWHQHQLQQRRNRRPAPRRFRVISRPPRAPSSRR